MKKKQWKQLAKQLELIVSRKNEHITKMRAECDDCINALKKRILEEEMRRFDAENKLVAARLENDARVLAFARACRRHNRRITAELLEDYDKNHIKQINTPLTTGGCKSPF